MIARGALRSLQIQNLRTAEAYSALITLAQDNRGGYIGCSIGLFCRVRMYHDEHREKNIYRGR